MNVPRVLRKQFQAYKAAGFTPVDIAKSAGSHFKVTFAEFSEPQFLTANIGEPRSLKNNIARFRKLAKENT